METLQKLVVDLVRAALALLIALGVLSLVVSVVFRVFPMIKPLEVSSGSQVERPEPASSPSGE